MQALHYRIISELPIECTDYLKNGFFGSFYDFVTSQDIEATNFLINLRAFNIIFILSFLPPTLTPSHPPLSIQLFNFIFWNCAIVSALTPNIGSDHFCFKWQRKNPSPKLGETKGNCFSSLSLGSTEHPAAAPVRGTDKNCTSPRQHMLLLPSPEEGLAIVYNSQPKLWDALQWGFTGSITVFRNMPGTDDIWMEYGSHTMR